MKALHKVNIIKRETTIFAKRKHPFINKLGYHTQGYIMGYMLFVQVVKMEPAYQKQNGHENLVLMTWVTSKVMSYQATCYLNPIHSKFCLPASYVGETKSSLMPDMASIFLGSAGSCGACT
jgi:prenyltransferase beta subunit